MASNKKRKKISHYIHGTTSVGARGQVVIPKKIRDALGLKKGSSFLVVQKGEAIVLLPTNLVENFITDITRHIKAVK